MPELEIPSFIGGDVDAQDEMTNSRSVTLSDLSSVQGIVNFRPEKIRSVHQQELDSHCGSDNCLNGSGHFDCVYGQHALQNWPETSEIATSVSRHSEEKTESRNEGPESSSDINVGSESGPLGQRKSAYFVHTAQNRAKQMQTGSTGRAAFHLSCSSNNSVKKRTPSPETRRLGSARFVPPKSAPAPDAVSTITPQIVTPLVVVSRPPQAMQRQRRARFLSAGHFSQQHGDSEGSDSEPDNEVLQEMEEQDNGAFGGRFLLLPPAERLLVPVANFCTPAMRRHSSF